MPELLLNFSELVELLTQFSSSKFPAIWSNIPCVTLWPKGIKLKLMDLLFDLWRIQRDFLDNLGLFIAYDSDYAQNTKNKQCRLKEISIFS